MSTPAQMLNTAAPSAPENVPSRETTAASGLFAFHDFIRPGEEPLYAELDRMLRHDLAPAGILEHNLVDEIRRAMWRLRRCGIVEEGFRDPEHNEAEARIQLSVDRARSQTHRLLHKCAAELRKLQTGRKYRDETFEAGADISDHGVADWRQIRKGIAEKVHADYQREKTAGMAEIDALFGHQSSFCKTAFSPGKAMPAAA